MDDSIQETVDVTRNDKASGVGLLTTTTSHLVNVLFPVHTNDAIQITFMISRERRADFCPFFPIENALLYLYRECSVISVLYLCCLPGTGFLHVYNQSCDCVCDVMSDVPLYHATLWCPFYRCIPHWSLSIKIHLSFIEPFASKWSPVLVWQAQIEL